MKPAGLLIWILGAITTLVATIALRNAVVWYGRPVPGVLVDVGSSVSSIGLPGWEGKGLGLHFPQQLTPAGEPPASGSRARTEAWDAAVAESSSRGVLEVDVYDSGVRAQTVVLHPKPLEALAWWIYGGGPIIAGMLYAGAGLLALWASPSGRLARTFAVFSVSIGLFLVALLDIHTQRSLAHVFFVTFALVPWSLIMLILRLPDDAPVLRRWPRLEIAGLLISLGLGVLASLTYELGGDTRRFQALFSWVLAGAGVLFTAGFVVRYTRARGERRRALLPLLISMGPPYLVAAVGVLLGMVVGMRGALKSLTDLVVFPTMTIAPLASAYVFVRYDLWGSRALLSRIATNLVLGAIACVIAIAGSAALAGSIGLGFRDAIAGAAVSTFFALMLVALARQVSDSTLFRSRADYKPTIEQLSADLLTITSPAEVAGAVEGTVRKWLPCEFVKLSLEADGGAALDAEQGATRLAPDGDGARSLPVSFGGRVLARLTVGPKRGGALFTSEDVDLLCTITNQGALAIAHAQAYQELEQRRKQQLDAWRGEREVLVETVAAEIAHEIRYPINYFRSVFERSARGECLDAEDVDVGREEVDRLERLVAGLRRMATHRLERAPASVMEVATRAEALLRDALGSRQVQLSVDPDALVRCDSDKVLQILVNLLSNALDAAGDAGRVGVSWEVLDHGAELVVWDDGPGFTGDPARLFAPWFTTKKRGTGLGLAITHRLVRAHGWNVSAQRRGDRTAFVVTIRREDIVQSSISSSDDLDRAEVA